VPARALALLPLAAVLAAGRAAVADPPPFALPGAPAAEAAPGPAAQDAAPAAAVPAVAPPAVDRNRVHREAVEAFEQLDVDHDGRLAPIETFDLATEVFEAADRDHDGKLSIIEWVDARFAELDAETPAPPEAATGPAPAPAPGAGGEPPQPAQ